MTLSPFTATSDEHGCDSAAGQQRPLPANASRAPSLKPSERYLLIAHRLGVSPREAEMLWIVANSGPIIQGAIAARMGSCEATPRVLVYRVRKRGIPIQSDPYVGYSLELAVRERVLAAASVAPVGRFLPLDLAGGSVLPASFEPAGDLTRQLAQANPAHSVSASLLTTDQHRRIHRCPKTPKSAS